MWWCLSEVPATQWQREEHHGLRPPRQKLETLFEKKSKSKKPRSVCQVVVHLVLSSIPCNERRKRKRRRERRKEEIN
jgi:hypothetical protein